MTDHPPRMAHQAKMLRQTGSDAVHAAFWQQGTGKTRFAIDTIDALRDAGEVDFALVVSPGNVQLPWLEDEWPRWSSMPDAPRLAWRSSRAGTVTQRRGIQALVSGPRFALAAFPYSALTTKAGQAALKHIVDNRRCALVLDESARIKNPSAKRTKAAHALGRRCAYRRVLTGTPIPNSPFDVYSQVTFLDPAYWRREAGIASFFGFKTRFADMVLVDLPGRHAFHKVNGYRNLETLYRLLDPISSRFLKRDVLDLPPKAYVRRTHRLGPGQRRLYDRLRSDWWAEHAGAEVSVPNVITLMTRLQQVACGYVPADGPDAEPIEWAGADNPRLECLREVLEDADPSQQVVVWHRFQRDGMVISKLLEELGISHGRYDGTVPQDEAEDNRRRFQAGVLRAFVGNPAKGGEGLNLQCATLVVYYSNSFDLYHREQSEDRTHRAGQRSAVTYVDIECEDSVDQHLIRALVRKEQVARAVLRDGPREWIG